MARVRFFAGAGATLLFLILAVAGVANRSASAQSDETVISGRASVSDGDTLRFGRMRVRLWGIDAPERTQVCGAATAGESSRSAMSRLAEGRAVVCSLRDVDRDNRPVAVCTADGRDLGAALVEQGWAWDFRRYSHGAYARQEAEARQARRGVHALNCELPWDWRARHRTDSARS